MDRLHNVTPDAAGQVQLTSTGTADVKTATPPAGAVAFEIGAEGAVNVRMTIGGQTPGATMGQVILGGQNPVYFPAADVVKVASNTAATSITNITWLF